MSHFKSRSFSFPVMQLGYHDQPLTTAAEYLTSYACDWEGCDMSFLRAGDLKRHQIQIHDKKFEPVPTLISVERAMELLEADECNRIKERQEDARRQMIQELKQMEQKQYREWVYTPRSRLAIQKAMKQKEVRNSEFQQRLRQLIPESSSGEEWDGDVDEGSSK
jgi:flagellar biosynthesis GTPase FlhF